MSDIGLVVVAVIYAWTAAGYLLNGHHAMALVFFSYAVSNIGFILAAQN